MRKDEGQIGHRRVMVTSGYVNPANTAINVGDAHDLYSLASSTLLPVIARQLKATLAYT